ncbi:MAG: M20 aminoacylase family protein [Leptospirales bacterium]|jgi:amidohydrolase
MHELVNSPELQAAMTAWRREIHQHPETAFQEHRTAAFVVERLKAFAAESGTPIAIESGIAGTGVVATIEGKTPNKPADDPGALHEGRDRFKAVALRADLDALPMSEANDFAHRSQNDGRMHACGHDGHTAMLLGAARHLAHTRDFRGVVHLIFQPAEENEGGGRAMIADGLFDRFDVDAVFGLHNWPGLATGKIAVQAGPVMAAFDNFDITLIGRGGHAAMPHQSVDPVVLAAQVIQAFQSLVSRGDPLDPVVISVTQLAAGDAYNIIPDRVHLKGTVRAFQAATRDRIEAAMGRTLAGLCEAAGASFEFDYGRRYPPTVNTRRESSFVAEVVRDLFGEEALVTDYPPSMGSEDFSFMLEQRPGCYVKLGAGPGPGLHNPRYDFNDEILMTGAAFWVGLVERCLKL